MKKRSARITTTNYTKTKKSYDTVSHSAALANLEWYSKDESVMWEHVFGRVRHIKNMQITRRYERFLYQQAYNARYGPSAMTSLFTPGSRNQTYGAMAVNCNVIKSCIDTATARIAKEKPRAFVLPRKGDYRLRKKARNLTKILDGSMGASGLYANGEDVFRDGGIYGDGYHYGHIAAGRMKWDVAKVDEVVIDEVDGMYNTPQEVFYTHPEPRHKLLKLYPDKAQEIEEARSAWRGEMSYMGQADMVEVIYAWRMPSSEDSGDGRRAVCICTATLESEEYTKDYLPIVPWQWTPPTYGPFGDGIAKELFGAQKTLTDILRGIVKSIRMFAVPRVWVSKMANVAQQTITNEMGVNTYAGEKPIFDTPPAAAPDIYAFVQWIIDWCYKQIGLSQLSSQSEKPAGLNAAVALRTYQDVETQRFAVVGQRWNRHYMQCARITLDMLRDEFKGQKSIAIKVPGRGFLETIDWADADLSEDEYDMAIYPTNPLADDPEGRLQSAQEYVQSGFMSKAYALQQLDIPILYDWVSSETSSTEAIAWQISRIIDDGVYTAPSAISDLADARTQCQNALLRGPEDELEPHKMDLLERYLQEVLSLIQAAQPPPAPPQAAPPGGPPGPPTPPHPGAPAAIGQAPAPPPAPLVPSGSGQVAPPS